MKYEFEKTLKGLNLQMFKVVSKKYKELGMDITPIQGTIIMAISENKEALCQKNLESFVFCNKSTLSSILDTMEKKKLIERRNDAVDTRKKIIVLTDKSKSLLEIIKKDKQKLDEEMTKGMTLEEKELFLTCLNKIKSNLERM